MSNGAAADGDHLWVWHTDSPVGRLGLATGDGGLRRLCFLGERPLDDLLADLSRTATGPVEPAAAPLDEVRRQLDEYFAGRRQDFTVGLDLAGVNGFRLRALQATAAIPYGHTAGYGEVAAAAGSPRAARAVGNAMATNPLALVVPCHRVVPAGGGRGSYGGGTAAKDLLLDLESRNRDG